MARSHARIQTAIWESDFTERNPDEQWLFFTMLSQRDLSPCGVLQLSARRLARHAAGMTAKRIERSLSGLAAARFVLVDEDTEEVCFRTFLHHDGINQSPNLLKSAARAYERIHSATIRQAVVAQVPEPIRYLWAEPLLRANPKTIGELLQGTLPPKPSPEGSPDASGNSHASAPARRESPSPFSLLPESDVDKSSSSTSVVGGQGAEEEAATPSRIEQAAALHAERAHHDRPQGPASTPSRWKAVAAHEWLTEHANACASYLGENPNLTARELVAKIERGTSNPGYRTQPAVEHPPEDAIEEGRSGSHAVINDLRELIPTARKREAS